MVFERNRYLESLWVCRKQQLSHGWKESKNCVLRMIVRTFGTWTRAVVSLKYSPSKGVVKKERRQNEEKNRSKVWLSLSLLVLMVRKLENQFGKIWKSKNPRCFRKANVAAKRDQDFYLSNSWMQVDIMTTEQLNCEMKMQSKSVILFIDSATVH